MARVKIEDVRRIKDPAKGTDYKVTPLTIPGNTGVDTDEFSFKIQTSEVPESSIEKTEVFIGEIAWDVPARRVWTRQMNAEIIEVRDYSTWKVLWDWHNHTLDWNNMGGYEEEYLTDVRMEMFDSKDNLVNSIMLYDVWLETFGPIQFDSSSADAIRIPVLVSYLNFAPESGG